MRLVRKYDKPQATKESPQMRQNYMGIILVIPVIIGLLIELILGAIALLFIIWRIAGLLFEISLKLAGKDISKECTYRRGDPKPKFIPSELPVYPIKCLKYIYYRLKSPLFSIHNNIKGFDRDYMVADEQKQCEGQPTQTNSQAVIPSLVPNSSTGKDRQSTKCSILYRFRYASFPASLSIWACICRKSGS